MAFAFQMFLFTALTVTSQLQQNTEYGQTSALNNPSLQSQEVKLSRKALQLP